MKIIICKGQFLGPISGADEILVNYAAHLRRSGHDVSVLLLYPYSPLDQYYRRLHEADVSIHTVAPGSVGMFLRSGRRLAQRMLSALPRSQFLVRKNAQMVNNRLGLRYQEQCRDFLKEVRADVIHVLSPDAGAMVLISAAHAAGVPIMYQEVGTPYDPPGFESVYKQFTAVLPLCTEISALSPLLAEMCRERLPFSKQLSVLPILVEDLRNGFRQNCAGSADITIGFAARIEHLKGPMTLLDAFAAASRVCRDLRLIIAGAGTLKPQLVARAHELGVASRCEFASVYKSQSERQSFMHRLDIFALPSLTEGTPNSIIEAMSIGLPIIATNVGGIPDLIAPGAGILVSPGDTLALSRAFVRMAQDAELRCRMGRVARDNYEKLFSPEAVLPMLLKTYSRISGRELSKISTPSTDLRPHPWERVASQVV